MGVRELFRTLHREVRGLHEAAYVLASFTLAAQLAALVRDRVFAHTFGAGETLDLFYAAFRLPDMLYALLASAVSLFVLIPFIERAQKEGAPAVRQLMSELFTVFSIALVVLGGMCALFAQEIVALLYGGFDTAAQARLVPLVQVLLLQPLILGISNLFAAYVQVRGRFLLYALAPVLYNIGIIVGALVFYPSLGEAGLALGVVLGACLHVGIQTPFMVREGMLPRFAMPNWCEIRTVVCVSVPRTITLSAQQLVLLVLIALASYFAAGSISSFTFAWNLQSVPLALFGVSYSVAAFPTLARLFTGGKRTEYGALIATAAKQIIFWGALATSLLIVLRAHVVRVLLGSGEFDWNATMMTAAVFALLGCSLIAQGLVILLVRAFYAAGKTLVPLVVSMCTTGITIGLAFWLLQAGAHGTIQTAVLASLLRVDGVPGVELLLLALAYSIGLTIQMVLLLVLMNRHAPGFLRALYMSSVQALCAGIVAAVVAYGALRLFESATTLPSTTLGILLQGASAGLLGVLTWALTHAALGSEELKTARRTISAKLGTQIQKTRGSVEGV